MVLCGTDCPSKAPLPMVLGLYLNDMSIGTAGFAQLMVQCPYSLRWTATSPLNTWHLSFSSFVPVGRDDDCSPLQVAKNSLAAPTVTRCCSIRLAKGRIAAATYKITVVHTEYSVYFRMGPGREIPPKLPLPMGGFKPPSTIHLIRLHGSWCPACPQLKRNLDRFSVSTQLTVVINRQRHRQNDTHRESATGKDSRCLAALLNCTFVHEHTATNVK